jgi:PAS domain S-box-containing protein
MNGPGHSEPLGVHRARPVAPFAVVAELSVLYEVASLGTAESEEQLGREAAEKVSRLFGARYFAILKGPLLDQKPVVAWGGAGENELKTHLLQAGPNQFRFSFPLGADEMVTVFAEQARPVDERQTRLYTILARRIQSAMTALKNAADRERALREVGRNEARLRSIVRSMGDAVMVADAEGRVELMNPAAEFLTGWSAAEAAGKSLSEVCRIADENTGKPLEDIAQRVLRDESRVEFGKQAVLVSKDGAARPVAGSVSPVQDELGQVVGLVAVFADRAAERRLRLELEESLRRAQTYLDMAGVIMVGLDRNGRVTLLNRMGEQILKTKAENALGADWFERFVPEKDRAEMRPFFDRMMAGSAELSFAYHENKVLCGDGTERLIAWANTLLRDENGAIVGALSSGMDITAAREAQRKIEDQLEELRRWHKVALGREEFMMSLKKEINELCRRLGEPPRYEITE